MIIEASIIVTTVCNPLFCFLYVWGQVALVVKNLPASVGDWGDASLIPKSARSPVGGHDHLLQYSCLENPTDRGAWQTSGHHTEPDIAEVTYHTCKAKSIISLCFQTQCIKMWFYEINYWKSREWSCKGAMFACHFSSVQFSRSVVSDSLQPHGLQHT